MMDEEYVEALLSGVKKGTIRLGVVKPDKELLIHSRGRIVARAIVESVEYRRVSELTDEDARLDGFPNRDALVRALKRLYPGLKPSDIVTVIRFSRVEPMDEPEYNYGGVSTREIAEKALRHLQLSPEERRVLELIARMGSLRKVALKLYGTLEARRRLRKILRKAYEELKRRKLIQ